MQKPALCDQSSIFWNFSKVRYPSPWTFNNEILSQSPRAFEFNVIPLGHSSDHQKCKNQLCVINPLFLGIFQISSRSLLRLPKMKIIPGALGPVNSMWFFWGTHRISRKPNFASLQPFFNFWEFFKYQVYPSWDFKKWKSYPGIYFLKSKERWYLIYLKNSQKLKNDCTEVKLGCLEVWWVSQRNQI